MIDNPDQPDQDVNPAFVTLEEKLKKPKKGGALRPLEKLNRMVYRTLLIGVPGAGLTIVAILLILNIADNPLGRWICRARLGPHQIVYSVAAQYGDSNTHLWLTNLEGSVACPLTDVQSGVASWSPDGSQIAFASLASGKAQIYVMDADGSNPHQLTNGDPDVENDWPFWSPDGKYILYTSYTATTKGSAFIMNADGSNQHRLPHGDYGRGWSPDGKKILYVMLIDAMTPQLWVMDSDGQNPKHLLPDDTKIESVDWSPDGTLIVFSSMRTGIHQIYTITPDGQNLKRLTNDTLTERYPHFSSDGKTILFDRQSKACKDIYAMDLDGKNQRRITYNRAIRNEMWTIKRGAKEGIKCRV